MPVPVAKRIRLPALLLIGAGVTVTILLTISVIQARSIARLSEEIATLRTGVQREIEEQNQLDIYIESNQRTTARNLREVRRLLNLSPGTYRFPEDQTDTATDGATSLPESERTRYPDQQFFAGVDRIDREREITALEVDLANRLPGAITPLLRAVEDDETGSLQLRSTGRLRWSIADETGTVWVQVVATPEAFVATTFFGSEIRQTNLSELTTPLSRELAEIADRFREYATAAQRIKAYYASPELSDALRQRSLAFGPLREEDERITQEFVTDITGDTAFVAELRRNPLGYTVDGTTAADFQEFEELLEQRIDRTDPRTASRRQTEQSFDRIAEVTATQAFRRFLEERGLSFDPEPRDTQDFFLFDILDDGSVFGSFAVQKSRGDIYITDADEIVITRLENADTDPLAALGASQPTEPAALPDEFPPGFQAGTIDGTNIVLIGTHEEKADSIILVHLSPEKTISMISIPRDIWWRQRKINTFFEVYGSQGLIDEISTMIDQPIHGWVTIDMYAFVEVVDILGGIEVTLDEPLIDPTYRVREDGTWGTLYYDAGTHHLGGIEALRLARSRHTSNDFVRASRQQMILAALRGRLNTLHAGNLDRVYGLIETIGRYIESSYSAWELAQFYLTYRNAEIVNRTGLSFDNVLYPTWSNLYLQGLTAAEVDDDFFLGGWILLPRRDDWSVIPWFVEQNLR